MDSFNALLGFRADSCTGLLKCAMERKIIDFDQGWDYMQKGITKLKKILEGAPETPFSSEEYMMLYTTIYNMCTQKPPNDFSQQLYDKYKDAFDEYIKITVLPSLREKHDEFMLRELVQRWLNHKVMVRWLSRFFHYLDRYFISRRSLPGLGAVGLTCFRESKVQLELLVTHANQLLEKENSGCHALLRDDKVEDLSRMYRLYHKIPKGLDPVANVFKQHITVEGTSLVQQAEEATSNQVLVRKFLELHDKYMVYVNDCFMNHTLFHKALKEAFEIFCNKTVAGSSSAELLSTFCDNILKKGGSEKLSDEAIEDTLEKVVKLLAYISDKDLFAEFYRKKLARRLLFDRSANDDHEKCILTKLKQQCGGQFTSKMEGMVVDLTLARDNQLKFEEYLRDNSHVNPGIDLTVTVLTTGFWPSYKSFDLNLPSEMIRCLEVFKGFYETRTKHRKLTWIYSLGTCHVTGKFETKNIELIVPTYPAAALLLFNNADRLSYSEIMTQLNLGHEDVARLLHSLSSAKYKILIKEPNNKVISQSDIFEFNYKFTDKMRRIKIPLPPADERKKVIEDVDKDRRYAIDAAIVRIMKSRKILGHQQLVLECVEQLGRMFKPDIKAIKKRIEDLITRDYLERDKDNPNTFSLPRGLRSWPAIEELGLTGGWGGVEELVVQGLLVGEDPHGMEPCGATKPK
ncbi:hypothetical protein JHK85_008361 [Glycine max]|nr:hypothetical protein JHK85_008361 [Glycine max]